MGPESFLLAVVNAPRLAHGIKYPGTRDGKMVCVNPVESARNKPNQRDPETGVVGLWKQNCDIITFKARGAFENVFEDPADCF